MKAYGPKGWWQVHRHCTISELGGDAEGEQWRREDLNVCYRDHDHDHYVGNKDTNCIHIPQLQKH